MRTQPSEWINGVRKAARQALMFVDAAAVKAIGVSGQQHGAAPLLPKASAPVFARSPAFDAGPSFVTAAGLPRWMQGLPLPWVQGWWRWTPRER